MTDPRTMSTSELVADAREDAVALRDMALVIAHPVAGPMAAKAVPATVRAVADSLDELARRLDEAEAKLRDMTARALGHAYTASMAEGGEEIQVQELRRERQDHAETRGELREAESQRDAAIARAERVERVVAAYAMHLPYCASPVRCSCGLAEALAATATTEKEDRR